MKPRHERSASAYLKQSRYHPAKEITDADYLFWREHAPPHFHALYGEHEALIDIRTLEVIAGQLPRRALAMTAEWALEHRKELLEDWDLCQRKQYPRKIQPLE